jgi:hypothetical protein
MLSVLRDLAEHPGGMPTPELAKRHDASAGTWTKALTRSGSTMRIPETPRPRAARRRGDGAGSKR